MRSGEVTDFIWTLGACPNDADAFLACQRSWADLPPSDSLVAHLNAIAGAASMLVPLLRDVVGFFLLGAALMLLFNPFMSWLRQ